MTVNAAALAERACPEQAFRFRATMVLVSIIASAPAKKRGQSGLAEFPREL